MYFVLFTKAKWKEKLNRPAQENPRLYFSQFIFCSICLAIAVVLEKNVYDDFMKGLPILNLNQDEIDVMRILVFFVVMGVLAQVQKFWKRTQPGAREDTLKPILK